MPKFATECPVYYRIVNAATFALLYMYMHVYSFTIFSNLGIVVHGTMNDNG